MASMRFPKVGPKSLRALAIEIRNEMSGGTATDDSRFSLRQIESEIKHKHGMVQKEIDDDNELKGIRPNAERVVPYKCLKLQETDDFTCKCSESGGALKKVVLPKFYEWKGQPFIQYLGTTDMRTGFVPVEDISEMEAYSDKILKPLFIIANSAAYVSLPMQYALVPEVTILGIPEDPTETNGKCFDVWNSKWAVPEYVKDMIKERIRRTYANMMLTTAQSADLVNNSQSGNQTLT